MDGAADGSEIVDLRPGLRQFRADVLRGLSLPQKGLPSKYFYDAEGARLFDAICGLPEYYPTRTELGILRAHAAEIAATIGPRAMVIELGSGSGVKTRLLLAALEAPAAYVPVEISPDYLAHEVRRLEADFPALDILPLCADFQRPFSVPDIAPVERRRVVFFPGSTLGNFSPGPARALLRHLREIVGLGGGLLIGIDLCKPRDVLERAYDDSAGVTAAFNLNLLARINRELGGDFDLQQFRHRARFNADASRMEMHLQSLREQTVHVAERAFHFALGETIHTENSYKYETAAFEREALAAGFASRQSWTDARGWFAVWYFEAA
ncbi:MAG TPA: L-histidine N(alpha)-methyltransferase [Nevskiaceae bacterium]